MRVRDHVALSTLGAAALAPWLGRGVMGLWAGGVLVDADHYAWFCLDERRLDPRAALRRFGEAQAPQHAATRALHSPAAALALLMMSACRPGLRPLAAGVGVHVALDRWHEGRMTRARRATLIRDGFRCQACGARGSQVETHLHTQPSLLPSYASHNLTSLCGPCHVAAHRAMTGARPWK